MGPRNLPAGAIVLRVEVVAVELTNWVPAASCPEGKQCIEFFSWFKYRARVKEVVSGEWTQAELEFANIQHGQMREDATRDCYVVLRPASPAIRSKIGVPFVADELLSVKFRKAEIAALLNGG